MLRAWKTATRGIGPVLRVVRRPSGQPPIRASRRRRERELRRSLVAWAQHARPGHNRSIRISTPETEMLVEIERRRTVWFVAQVAEGRTWVNLIGIVWADSTSASTRNDRTPSRGSLRRRWLDIHLGTAETRLAGAGGCAWKTDARP